MVGLGPPERGGEGNFPPFPLFWPGCRPCTSLISDRRYLAVLEHLILTRNGAVSHYNVVKVAAVSGEMTRRSEPFSLIYGPPHFIGTDCSSGPTV